MRIQQMFVALLCFFLSSQQIAAVVNNAQTKSSIGTDLNVNNSNAESSGSSSSAKIADSLAAASSDKEANRREAPIAENYGVPVPHEVYGPPPDTYVPSSPSNVGLPVPVYGVPDSPINNIIYPGPPPDIPPELTSALSESYGLPKDAYGPPKETYGPPKEVYGLPNEVYGPPKESYGPPREIYGTPKETYGPPPTKYGPPPFLFPKPPKILNPPPFHKPKPFYGPPRLHGPPHHKPHFKPPKPSYGPPLKLQYGPPKHHNGPSKPYHGSSNIQGPPSFHGLPSKDHGPQGFPHEQYGPPKQQYGPPREQYGPPPKEIYGPPTLSNIEFNGIVRDKYGPPKEQYGPPKEQYGAPKEQYGPPKEQYGPPKEQYGPPKEQYGPPKGIKEFYGPSKLQGPPKEIYGPPSAQYGPPEHIHHGPSRPVIPAPPTPPDIKYDGWQPIPGLVSRPPSGNYGVPHAESHGNHHGDRDLQFNGDFVPPPAVGHGISSLSLGSSYGNTAGISDSYGAPLNTVTGSGGIVSTSGDAHIHNQDQSAISLGLSAAGIGGGYDGQLSVIRSIGYEIFPHRSSSNSASGGSSSVGYSGGGDSVEYNIIGGDSYSAPPLSSYSLNGPYAASHSYKNNGVSSSFGSSFGSFNSGFSSNFDKAVSSSGIGLIPPSGLYGVPPSGQYGTPLLSGTQHLKINPPKHPVIFREPVPTGLIQSIGNYVAQKDAAGVIDTSHVSNYNGYTYIPPAIPELSLHVKPKAPSSLYSLPSPVSTVSFNGGSGSEFSNSFQYQQSSFGSAHDSSSLNSYSNIEGTAYAAPLQSHIGGLSVGVDNSLPTQTIDLTQYGVPSFGNTPHDCTAHKSQLTYGVPSANSYTASLSSLKTNIGGGGHYPSLTYGSPDLQAAHSLKSSVSNGASVNSIGEGGSKEQYGKSLAESFAPGGEVIKSQSIDFNNIPVQGALGAYTLQIQAADGAGGTDPSSVHIPHDQVLNDGLLQSILAAIEQPQQKDIQFLGQHTPLNVFNQISGELQLPTSEEPQDFSKEVDDEAQHSIKNSVVVLPPAKESTIDSNKDSQTAEDGKRTEAESSLHLIDNNEIALYFHNNSKGEKVQKGEESEVKNGQQYGSYVSFKTPNASYVYGELKSETPREQK